MQWHAKEYEETPQEGSTRIVTKLAFLPTRIEIGTNRHKHIWVWLETYFCTQTYCRKHHDPSIGFLSWRITRKWI